jgi:hypothetical protein
MYDAYFALISLSTKAGALKAMLLSRIFAAADILDLDDNGSLFIPQTRDIIVCQKDGAGGLAI